jgi:hypothetical protein
MLGRVCLLWIAAWGGAVRDDATHCPATPRYDLVKGVYERGRPQRAQQGGDWPR